MVVTQLSKGNKGETQPTRPRLHSKGFTITKEQKLKPGGFFQEEVTEARPGLEDFREAQNLSTPPTGEGGRGKKRRTAIKKGGKSVALWEGNTKKRVRGVVECNVLIKRAKARSQLGLGVEKLTMEKACEEGTYREDQAVVAAISG